MAAIIPSAQPFEEEDTTVYSKVTFWTRLRRHKLAVAGIVVLGVIALCAILAPLLAPFDPNAKHFRTTCIGKGKICFRRALKTPYYAEDTRSVRMRSDADLLSRLLFGARISLKVGIFTVLFEVIIGVIVGSFAGYYGGWVDWVMMRITDVFLSIPLLPLLLVLTAIVAASSNKASLSFWVIVLIIGALSWPTVARLVRASFLVLREREFAEAARAVGNGDLRIIFRHLLPNAIAPIVSRRSWTWPASSSWSSDPLVLGVRHPAPHRVLGQHALGRPGQPPDRLVGSGLPGPRILFTVLSINYIGDGLRDALDPNMK